ncbi:Hsp20/alpha crystallin family protein [Bacteriovorax sp. Seq25_V]|uniref:Hsp20 family protein n=1 Tax=Bacteriovorax sp. Seq25_V TaxID=1201288 RepID=UPI00038A4FA8|nr:Hsp20/alpha crystallin family protein [Bacteriovorax sp. Seq25_V]EQC46336.1 Hsp20/alpha crystallin family protein [Bacteriovorax sp. Seq25_V]
MKTTLDQQNREYLNKLTEAQRNIIAKKENEIEKIDVLYDKKLENVKKEGDLALYNQVELNKVDIENSLLSKQERLEKIQAQHKVNTQKFVDQEQALKSDYFERYEDLTNQHEQSIIDVNTRNQLINRDIVDKSNRTIKDIQKNSELGVQDVLFDTKIRADELSRDLDSKFITINRAHDNQVKVVSSQHDTQLEEIQRNHNQTIDELQRKNSIDRNQRIASEKHITKSEVDHHNEVLKQKRLSFEQKYRTLEQDHTEILNRLKTKFDTDIKKLVGSYAQAKDLVANKAQDDFYHITKLEPTIVDQGKHYLVTLPVPEFEKEQVNLTAQERNLNIVLTRKFQEETQAGDEKFDTRRTEVLSKNFKVAEIMDPRTVKSNYQDGILSFQIAKL